MKYNINLKRGGVEAQDVAGTSDQEIAAAGFEAIQWLTTIPSETVKINVREGWVTLEGTVEWWHQRDTLSDVMRHVPGVKGVTNKLTLSEFAHVQAA